MQLEIQFVRKMLLFWINFDSALIIILFMFNEGTRYNAENVRVQLKH